MGICRNCGCEIIGGDGICQTCSSNIADERQWNWEITMLFRFFWKHILKPSIPFFIILTLFSKLGMFVLQQTESKVMMALVQYPGYLVTTIVLGYLLKKNIHKGLWRSYWPKAFIYYTGMLFFVSGIRIISGTMGMLQYTTQDIIMDTIFITLGIAQTVWITKTNKLAKQSIEEISY